MRLASLRNRAFTFIEILIVVVILAIAAALIIPQVGSAGDLKAAAASRIVMADLVYAQNRAIATQTKIYVLFDPSAQKYALLSSVSPRVYLQHPVNRTDYEVVFGTSSKSGMTDTTLVSANFDGEKVIGFDELGSPYCVVSGTGVATAMSNSGTIVLKSGTAKSLQITVEANTSDLSVTTLP